MEVIGSVKNALKHVKSETLYITLIAVFLALVVFLSKSEEKSAPIKKAVSVPKEPAAPVPSIAKSTSAAESGGSVSVPKPAPKVEVVKSNTLDKPVETVKPKPEVKEQKQEKVVEKPVQAKASAESVQTAAQKKGKKAVSPPSTAAAAVPSKPLLSVGGIGPAIETAALQSPMLQRLPTKPVVYADEDKDDSESDSDSDEESAAVVAPAAKSVVKVKDSDVVATFGLTNSNGVDAFDGIWSEVGKSSKPKKSPKAAAAVEAATSAVASGKAAKQAPAVPAAPVPEMVTKAAQHGNKAAIAAQTAELAAAEQQPQAAVEDATFKVESIVKSVEIDSSKKGIVIGQKGVTLKAIEAATNCKINFSKETVGESTAASTSTATVTGNTDVEVNKAVRAVTEMVTKGYCLLLKGESFSEGSIQVHPKDLGEIIGKQGATLRAIQDKFDVKINTPPNVDRLSTVPVKVSVVGDKKAVQKAKDTIKELNKWHHTDVTHPGLVHEDLPLDASVHKYVIGARGAEIKHIQGNFKVSVHIPNANSAHQGVLVVGEPDGVSKASAYIQKKIESALAPREEKPSAFELLEEEERAEEEDAGQSAPWLKSYIKDPAQPQVIDFGEFPAMSASKSSI